MGALAVRPPNPEADCPFVDVALGESVGEASVPYFVVGRGRDG